MNQMTKLEKESVNNMEQLTEPKLDKISQALINKICSYLGIRSYTKFQRCNRTIFIAARSPAQLYHISDRDIGQYLRYCDKNNQMVDKNRFYRVKSLKMSGYFSKLKQNGSFLMFGNLRRLFIRFRNDNILNEIMQSKNIKLTKLNKLTLDNSDFTSPLNEAINNILQKPSNLKFLALFYCHYPPTIYPNSQNIIRNLSGLSLRCGGDDNASRNMSVLISLANDIVNACSSELMSFHTDSELILFNFNHVRFPNLTELCLQYNYNPNVISVISKFKHLKRIRFNLCEFRDNRMELTTKCVNGLLSLDELESIDFGYIRQERIPMLLKLIQNGLMIHKKKKLKIYMYCYGAYDESVGGDIHIDMELFVNSLEFFVSDFMFIFSAEDIPRSQRENIEKWLNNLDSERFGCINKDFCCDYFVVANKGCKINSCQREWRMECTACEYSICQ